MKTLWKWRLPSAGNWVIRESVSSHPFQQLNAAFSLSPSLASPPPLVSGGTFFAKKMRDAKYVTMIDPFTQKYGKWGSLQAFPSAISEIFWSASILGALGKSVLLNAGPRSYVRAFITPFFYLFAGSTLKVILHIDTRLSIIISAIIAVCYTLLGGLLSVAYTDVFQIAFIAFGLVSVI